MNLDYRERLNEPLNKKVKHAFPLCLQERSEGDRGHGLVKEGGKKREKEREKWTNIFLLLVHFINTYSF